MFGMSLSHLILLTLVILIVFGAGKLPQVMSDLGRGIKAFKDSLKEDESKKEHEDSKS